MEKNKYSIGAAAKLVGLTEETLRHYDRIGLLHPHEKDTFTGYRYYTDGEIVTLRTISLLRCMDISLPEIAHLLGQEDLKTVVEILLHCQEQARERIRHIEHAIHRMERARESYETLIDTQESVPDGLFQRSLPARTVLISRRQDRPDVVNLWQYHSYFKDELPQSLCGQFVFDDTAAMLCSSHGEETHLVAVCTEYPDAYEGLRLLPAGEYLCLVCRPDETDEALFTLKEEFCRQGKPFPAWYLAQVRIVGLLKWKYLLQVPLTVPSDRVL